MTSLVGSLPASKKLLLINRRLQEIPDHHERNTRREKRTRSKRIRLGRAERDTPNPSRRRGEPGCAAEAGARIFRRLKPYTTNAAAPGTWWGEGKQSRQTEKKPPASEGPSPGGTRGGEAIVTPEKKDVRKPPSKPPTCPRKPLLLLLHTQTSNQLPGGAIHQQVLSIICSC